MYSSRFRTGSPTAYALPAPDPFRDMATGVMPYSVPAMYRYAEYFALSNETFREGLGRTAAYFLTELELDGEAEEDEKRKYKNYLVDDAGLLAALFYATEGMLVYGVSYLSAIQPFIRWLICPGKKNGKPCALRYRFNAQLARDKRYKFRWQDGFHMTCPACGFNGNFGKPDDRPDPDAPISFRVWNPYDIRPHYEGFSDKPKAFDWVIPADYRSDVRRGDPITLESAPWDVLKAVTAGGDFRFAPGYVHCWTDRLLPGVRTRGCGIPRAIVNFRILYYLQILRRYNEALGACHVMPFRVVSPQPGGRDAEAGDVIRNASAMGMAAKFMSMVSRHQQDPGSWHWSPIPLNYQSLGSDARTMAPRELIDQAEASLLNGIGNPVELYRMSITAQAQPLGLRLYERFHAPLVHGLNRATAFWVDRVVRYKKWEPVVGKLARSTLVDDVEKQQLKVQMAATGQLARGEAHKVVGTDFMEQTRRKYDENLVEQEIAAEYSDKAQRSGLAQTIASQTDPAMMAAAQQQQQAQGGGQGQGGGQDQGQQQQQPQGGDTQAAATPGAAQPGQIPWDLVPPSGQSSVDPLEFKQRADSFAKVLLDPAVSQQQRTSALSHLRQTNDLFHNLVRMAMERQRNQAATAGRDQVLAQQARAG